MADLFEWGLGRVSAFVSEEPSLGEPVAKEVEHYWMGFHTIS